MTGVAYRVRVPRDQYPEPHIGDRVVDEERGPLVVTEVVRDHDWWQITYGEDDPPAPE